MIRNITIGALLILGMAFQAGSASAAAYADQMDPMGTVSYTNISDLNGLYGAPTASLNSLDFTPVGFDACTNITCATGNPSTSDLLTLDINAVPGQQITEIGITEGLDYNLQAIGFGSVASVTVVADVFIDIFEVDQQSVNVQTVSRQVVFTSGGVFAAFPQGANPIDTQSGLFGGVLSVDMQTVLAEASTTIIGDVTGVQVSLGNALTSTVFGSGHASIRKRDADFVSLTINGGTPVPEPGTALLLMGGLTALASYRRRA